MGKSKSTETDEDGDDEDADEGKTETYVVRTSHFENYYYYQYDKAYINLFKQFSNVVQNYLLIA